MLRSNMCDYSDVYIVVKGKITVIGFNNDDTKNKKLTYKNNVLVRSSMSKIDKPFINNAEGLGIVMLMYNLLEYGDNFSLNSASLWKYQRG